MIVHGVLRLLVARAYKREVRQAICEAKIFFCGPNKGIFTFILDNSLQTSKLNSERCGSPFRVRFLTTAFFL